MSRVLVTGGLGFIGTRLVRKLVSAGHSVRILDLLVPQVHGPAPTVPRWLRTECDVRVADVCDREAVHAVLEDVDAVAHLAAETGPAQSMYEIERYTRANVQGTAVLLEGILARRGQIRRLVVASSRAIYGEGHYVCETCGDCNPEARGDAQLRSGQWEPLCPGCGRELDPVATDEDSRQKPTSIYAVSKLAQEQMCLAFGRAYDVPAVALRYQNVYGGGQSLSNPYVGVLAIFTARVRSGRPLALYEDGRILRDFVHVDDVAEATRLALVRPLEGSYALNVGSGRPHTIHDVARTLCRTLGMTVPIEITGQYRVGDIRHCWADLSRARAVLGFEPRTSLADGLRELCEAAENAPMASWLERATSELKSAGLFRECSRQTAA